LDILAGGFLIATLEKYSGSVIRQKSSSPKIIPLAPALIHSFAKPSAVDEDPEWRGHVFEAAIGAHLLRTGGDLFYWREGKHEVDFVHRQGKEVLAIEVKSGRRKRQHGVIAFKKKFPDAMTTTINWESGEHFLSGAADISRLS
jgi:uncharacterized protein